VTGNREQGTGNREQGTEHREQGTKRKKFAFQVLTKDFKNVILILIRKNYLNECGVQS
jgi:hypothetical protein